MPTWMAVEDEDDISLVVMGMFEAWGLSGILFSEGDAALAWLDRVDANQVNEELPELALIDIRLPTAASGVKVGSRIRRSKRLGNIAIVLTTAYRLSHTDEQKVLAEADADALIYKPLPNIMELRETLNKILATRKAIDTSNPKPIFGQ